MKIVSAHTPDVDNIHVLVLTDAELAAVRHALVRFALTSMRDIEAEQAASPEAPLRANWRVAQSLDLDLRRTLT